MTEKENKGGGANNEAADTEVSDFKTGVSRRDIMKVGAITAATLAAPTILLNKGAKSMAEAKKDVYEADLVIIGTGFAGIFAAIEATKSGKSVVMLIKALLVGRAYRLGRLIAAPLIKPFITVRSGFTISPPIRNLSLIHISEPTRPY